jgi:hypothetical protein
MFRMLAVLLLVAIAAAAPASAQQHWLVGTWKGALGNLASTNRFGPDRTMEVKSVSPDGGKAQGTWIAATGSQPISITVSGNDITFSTAGTSGASYKMTHNASTLNGSWAPASGGAGGTVNMKKQ